VCFWFCEVYSNLHIEDDLLSQAIQHLKSFLEEHKKSNFTYIDELGDTIKVIDGKEYVIPTQKDLKIMRTPHNKRDFMGLEDFKKELCII
jgi:hypothetical protein